MVKAKELKLLRKRLDQLVKSNENPLEEIQRQQQQQRNLLSQLYNDAAMPNDAASIVSRMSTVQVTEKPMFQIVTSAMNSSDVLPKPSFLVHYYTSLKGHPLLLQQCLQIFTENMKELYEKSSWGYNITTKQEELLHPHARFILFIEDNCSQQEASLSSQDNPIVAAFVHYRYCYNDDDDPSELVLYIYEIQVLNRYQKQGIGLYGMQIIEQMVANANGASLNVMTSKSTSLPVVRVSKVMLTVFRNNRAAMHFYMQKLKYQIDPTSPSCYNQVTDYEILSKAILA